MMKICASSCLRCLVNISTRPLCTSVHVNENVRVKQFDEIPGPRGLPYFGNLLSYKIPGTPYQIHKRRETLQYKYDTYGPIMKETIAGETTVHLFDPDLIKEVWQTDTKTPHIPSLMDGVRIYREERGLNPGLGNLNGELWYRLRAAVQQMMMRPSAVYPYLSLVTEVADEFIEYITENIDQSNREVPDLLNKLLLWNVESASYKCFGKRLNGMNNDPNSICQKLVDSNNTVFSNSTKILYQLPFMRHLRTRVWKQLFEAEDCIMNNGSEMMDDALTTIEKQSKVGEIDNRFMFLTYLLSKEELSYKDIHIITMSLFTDGLRTTVPAIAFNLYHLAKNPKVQQKVYEEIQSVLPLGEPITVQALNELNYLKACIKESFRLLPIGMEISRVLQKDMILNGYHLPNGTRIDINQSVMHRSARYYERPDEYLPERWLRDGSASKNHPYVLTPFGHGTRMCVGRRFAEQELNVLLVMFLQRFRFEWHHGDLGHNFLILEFPDRPAQVQFHPR